MFTTLPFVLYIFRMWWGPASAAARNRSVRWRVQDRDSNNSLSRGLMIENKRLGMTDSVWQVVWDLPLADRTMATTGCQQKMINPKRASSKHPNFCFFFKASLKNFYHTAVSPHSICLLIICVFKGQGLHTRSRGVEVVTWFIHHCLKMTRA